MDCALTPRNTHEWTSTDGTPLPDRASALELLHPDGLAKRTMLIGSNCPPRLAPIFRESASQLYDVIVLAPSLSECRTTGWLEQAVDVVNEQLAPHGVGYVMVPAVHRKRLRRLIRRSGLEIESAWAHRPDHATSRYLVPLQHPAARYAFKALAPLNSTHQHLMSVALALPGGGAFVADRVPAIGFAVRRPGARPLLQWLSQHCTDSIEHVTAAIKTRPPGRSQIATLICFNESQKNPLAIVKIGLTKEAVAECMSEVDHLRLLGSIAREAGIAFPKSRAVQIPGAYPTVIQSPLDGLPAASLLMSGKLKSATLMDPITNWLVAWNSATLSHQPWDADWLEQAIMAPARKLAPLLEDSSAYLAWLATRCAEAAGRTAPMVMTHNDLGAGNILVDSQGGIGVVDWANAREQDIPLLDFFFAMASVVATTLSYAEWPHAVSTCFAGAGSQTAAVAQNQRSLSRAIGMPADLIDICFHACWLRRALTEHLEPSFMHTRPFLEIVRQLVRQPNLWPAHS
ncbi:hypothetical protein BH23CHL1_BH23CHL1_04610 [soil metagenome]